MKLCLLCGTRHDRSTWVCPSCGRAPRSSDGIAVFSSPTGVGAPVDADYLVAELTDAERWHFWFQSRRRLVLWLLDRHCRAARSLLDVGCGTGFLLEGLRDRRRDLALAGCDVHTGSLAVARKRVPSAFVFQAVADGLPFVDEFDAVTALDVIEHIDDDEAALGGMCRAIKPGGALLLTVPQHPSLWSAVDDFSCHRRRYTRAELVSKARAAGFEVVTCTSFFALTLPLLVASRWRTRPDTFDPAAEFRIPRSVNILLDRMMECEWWVIKSGVSLPIGGSLMMLGRRLP